MQQCSHLWLYKCISVASCVALPGDLICVQQAMVQKYSGVHRVTSNHFKGQQEDLNQVMWTVDYFKNAESTSFWF